MHLRLSPRHLGEMLLKDFCCRCFWFKLLLGFKLPFQLHMPGIMYNLDNFEKAIVQAYYNEHDALPRWLEDLGCTGPVEFPPKLTTEFPKHDITLVGMPDAVFQKANGKLVVVDYKTAKGEDDALLPLYETQLLGYSALLEANEVGTVENAALVYFANELAGQDDPLDLLTKDGFKVPFRVKIHEVEINRDELDPLLKRIRELADRAMPPEGRYACKDCGRLQKLLDDEVKRRGSEDYQRNKDGLVRVWSREWEAARQRAREAWEQDTGDVVEDLATDANDSVPAAWDL